MSNLVIFAFGFIVGGGTAILLVGLLVLSREKARNSKGRKMIGGARESVRNTEIPAKVRAWHG